MYLKKIVPFLGIIAYVALGILAYLYFLERTAFLDISFHLFYILKDGDLAIQNNRFGAVFTQIYPLLGSKVGLSLSSIMKLYSVGFIFYYFSVFLWITFVLRSYKFGLLMILFSTLMVSDTFFWIQSELPQGLAFLILYFALLYSLKDRQDLEKKWYIWPIFSIMIVTIAFFHPLLMFPFLFFSVFLYLDQPAIRKVLKLGLVLYIVILSAKTLFFRTAYDTSSLSGLKNFYLLFPDYFLIHSNQQFLEDLLGKYLLLFITFLGMLIFYIRERQMIKFYLMLSFFMGYLLLVNVSYPAEAGSFYMENLYLPLSVFVAVPFVFDFRLPQIKIYQLLIIIMVGFRLIHIGSKHDFYTARVELLTNYMASTNTLPQKKIVVAESLFPMDTLLMSWASPYEFWLLSTIQDKETRSIMITDNVDEMKWTAPYNTKFITKWGTFEYSELPAKYFILKDSTHYQYIDR